MPKKKVVIRCDRCRRRLRNPYAPNEWNLVFSKGRYVGNLCPDCQTPEEHAEAVINEATLDYSRTFFDSQGRAHVRPKAVGE